MFVSQEDAIIVSFCFSNFSGDFLFSAFLKGLVGVMFIFSRLKANPSQRERTGCVLWKIQGTLF